MFMSENFVSRAESLTYQRPPTCSTATPNDVNQRSHHCKKQDSNNDDDDDNNNNNNNVEPITVPSDCSFRSTS